MAGCARLSSNRGGFRRLGSVRATFTAKAQPRPAQSGHGRKERRVWPGHQAVAAWPPGFPRDESPGGGSRGAMQASGAARRGAPGLLLAKCGIVIAAARRLKAGAHGPAERPPGAPARNIGKKSRSALIYLILARSYFAGTVFDSHAAGPSKKTVHPGLPADFLRGPATGAARSSLLAGRWPRRKLAATLGLLVFSRPVHFVLRSSGARVARVEWAKHQFGAHQGSVCYSIP